jgi:predicted ATPase
MLETLFPEIVETQPELVAHHYTEAGRSEQAVEHWYKAGQQALQRSANLEAVGHLRKAIEVLMTLVESTGRDRQELALQNTLGPALMATKGYGAPEVGEAYVRAHELSERVGDAKEQFISRWGLWVHKWIRAEHHTSLAMAQQLIDLSENLPESEYLLEAHLALGVSQLLVGELQTAREHLQESFRLYDPERHGALAIRYGGIDPRVGCLAYLSWTLWLLGDVEQAISCADQAQALSRRLDNVYTLARSLYWDAILRQFVGDWQAVRANAEEAIAFATEQNIALVQAVGPIILGSTLVRRGQEVDGAIKIRQGIQAYRKTGAVCQVPHLMVPLAEAARALGQPEDGLDVLAEAMVNVESTGERYFEAELHRLQGEMLLAQSPSNHGPAEGAFKKALAVAGAQQAKSLELRAAMGLARLWHDQDKTTEARDLLSPVYGWFTEGFDTADLKEAKSLLEDLT